MENFQALPFPQVFFGQDVIQKLPEVLSRYGKRVLLVYGQGSIKRIGLYQHICKQLEEGGFTRFELSGVEPNPRITTVEKGVRLARQEGIEVLLAVGGGSVIDCAKAISVGTSYLGENLWRMIVEKPDTGPTIPLVTVLTAAGTGSESNKGYVISNWETQEKRGSSSPHSMPKVSFLDPRYTCSVSPAQTASGTIDIMSHVLESYFKVPPDAYLQDRFAEAILKTCIHYGPIAFRDPEDLEARANLMLASGWALNGLTSNGKKGGSSCHPIEHVLSAYYDLTHGVGLAIITGPWMRYILSEKTLWKFVEYGCNVWGIPRELPPQKIALRAIESTEAFFGSFGLPMTLRQAGIHDTGNFEEMAKKSGCVRPAQCFCPLGGRGCRQYIEEFLLNDLFSNNEEVEQWK